MSTFALTRHAEPRIAQRGIPADDVELIAWIGSEVEGGYLVRAEDCQAIERAVKRLLNRVECLRGKRVVVADGQIVTAYHASKAEERRLLKRR